MPNAFITIQNGPRLRDKFGHYMSSAGTVLDVALEDVCRAIQTEAVAQIMTGAKSGVHWPGAKNPSSAPGEAPAVQTGALVSSIQYEKNGSQWLVGVPKSSTAPYAIFLEYGTHTKDGAVWIAPRPFMRPAYAKVEPDMRAMVQKAWLEASNKVKETI